MYSTINYCVDTKAKMKMEKLISIEHDQKHASYMQLLPMPMQWQKGSKYNFTNTTFYTFK